MASLHPPPSQHNGQPPPDHVVDVRTPEGLVGSSPPASIPPSNNPLLPTTVPVGPPAFEKSSRCSGGIPSAFYIASWIACSSAVILFNKYILDRLSFHFPIFLTTWHLAFATVMTQVLARSTSMLESRKLVAMTGKVYLRAILPIGFFFSLSLICGNVAYLFLSVSFIQMLKAMTPVAVLVTGWLLGTQNPNMKTLVNVLVIVVGVMVASVGEVKFVLVGALFQISGLVFEAIRIVMVERLLSSAEFKMDPIVSLYYFAPACTVMNGVVWIFMEAPKMGVEDIRRVGVLTLLLNGAVAFALNVSVVLLIGKTSSLVYTLSGVLKDILLVVASMLVFGDPVSGLQVFGYGIALSGLVYYKVGRERLFAQGAELWRGWGECGMRHPVRRKVGVVVAVALMLYAAVRFFARAESGTAYEAGRLAKSTIGVILGSDGGRTAE